jgi:hypothetical protein
LTGVPAAALEELRQKQKRNEGEERQYQNLLLTLKSDKELKGFVASNTEFLRGIIVLMLKGEVETANSLARSRFLTSVESVSNGVGVIKLCIGGVLDSTVGILYVPDNADPLQMDPNEYIYVEKVEGNWYLYKTT